MPALPPVFSLLPSTKSRVRRVVNTVFIAVVIAVATAIEWLVLIVLAIALDFAASILIRSVGFTPNIEDVMLHIPQVYVAVLIVGITLKSIWDLIATNLTADKWGLPRKKK